MIVALYAGMLVCLDDCSVVCWYAGMLVYLDDCSVRWGLPTVMLVYVLGWWGVRYPVV